MYQRDFWIVVLILIGGIAALHGVSGCGPSVSLSSGSYCCTKGDVQTAYPTLTGECPEGYRCIAETDAANARLFQTCRLGPAGPRPTGAGPVLFPGAVPNRLPDRQPAGAAPARSAAEIVQAPRPAGNAVRGGGCLDECPPGSRSPRCVTATTPAFYAPALSRLAASLLESQSVRVETPSILEGIRIPGRPCARETLVVQGNRLMNRGAACVLESPIPELRLTARIELPASLEAVVERREASAIFRPVSAAQGASIRLASADRPGPHALDATMGGRVLQAETNGQYLYLQTSGGCLGLALSAPSRPGQPRNQ